MKQVKIIVSDGNWAEYDEASTNTLVYSITEWENCTDDQYKELSNNRYELQRHMINEGQITSDQSIVLLTKGVISVPQALSKLEEILAIQKKRIEDAQKKRQKDEAARVAKAAATKAERDLKKLAKLQAQYGNIAPK